MKPAMFFTPTQHSQTIGDCFCQLCWENQIHNWKAKHDAGHKSEHLTVEQKEAIKRAWRNK